MLIKMIDENRIELQLAKEDAKKQYLKGKINALDYIAGYLEEKHSSDIK
jgi:hypothetical protein